MAASTVCVTCGNHYLSEPPGICVVCADERQWVPASGQVWTTLDDLAVAGHGSDIRAVEPGLTGIGASPAVAIGQRSLVIQTDDGNLLWDPSGFIDQDAITAVEALGGLRYVTASHPHFYGSIASWSGATGAEILLPSADVSWLEALAGPAFVSLPVRTWSEAVGVLPGVTLIQCGGHFPGSAVVHWAPGADGRGVLLSGDTIFVTPGEDRVTFVWSAPNRLPLAEPAVRGVWAAVRDYDFDRVYGGWWSPVIRAGAKDIVARSTQRYVEHLHGNPR
jgi:glyoxylase-like metal-dependent hydrolase (beta-lactamase superfamily II)